jgi:hypothetical protein
MKNARLVLEMTNYGLESLFAFMQANYESLQEERYEYLPSLRAMMVTYKRRRRHDPEKLDAMRSFIGECEAKQNGRPDEEQETH